MKRIIAIVLALVLLATGGLAGFVYAQVNGHEPMTGQKLVGWGAYAGDYYPDGGPPRFNQNTIFLITNPDGVSEITIERISIIQGDETLIYEGPLLHPNGTLWTEPMTPHEIRNINFGTYVPDRTVRPGLYTLEIFWAGSHKNGLPLIGKQVTSYHRWDEAGSIIDSHQYAVPMVNMEQKLKLESEE